MIFVILGSFVSLWNVHVQWRLNRCLWEGHDKIQLSCLPTLYDGEDEEELDHRPCNYWGVGVPVVDSMDLLSAMYI